MADSGHVGKVVFNERGYLVAEVLEGARVSGYSLIGPMASDSIIYGSRMEALEALQDIEARLEEAKPHSA